MPSTIFLRKDMRSYSNCPKQTDTYDVLDIIEKLLAMVRLSDWLSDGYDEEEMRYDSVHKEPARTEEGDRNKSYSFKNSEKDSLPWQESQTELQKDCTCSTDTQELQNDIYNTVIVPIANDDIRLGEDVGVFSDSDINSESSDKRVLDLASDIGPRDKHQNRLSFDYANSDFIPDPWSFVTYAKLDDYNEDFVEDHIWKDAHIVFGVGASVRAMAK
ncbi:hypothetical protein SK128_026835 [Halocaridina rubra]|uniref:Uncharacterized protein n=1 Tax=Halocaridina rubra TaxID=373956 RepID=A0AAN8WXJ7_HALRR